MTLLRGRTQMKTRLVWRILFLGKTSPRLRRDSETTNILNPSIKGDCVSSYAQLAVKDPPLLPD